MRPSSGRLCVGALIRVYQMSLLCAFHRGRSAGGALVLILSFGHLASCTVKLRRISPLPPFVTFH